MGDPSIEICCPECFACIDVNLTELRFGGSTVCPKCGVRVKFSDADLCKVKEELENIEGTIKRIEKSHSASGN